ncbi:MAG TPA: hypothetical protein VMF10_08360 [Candidatus Aquilonibacter sp.]|nr:hypothetical protein [Candidatus Aquilonibacter sp.]
MTSPAILGKTDNRGALKVDIDLRSLEVVGRIEAGQGPDGLAWVGH